ncbi:MULTISPECIES: hypothetical protein [unclassified Streptomyces]|uniref:hypothetical protein n=1 Tax=unclassified Streptomyces TaxID=2593676 RepID=UPI002270E176|nr:MULTISPECIES: hypothetical protein [unclassified Streptomyces]MCY0919611.1 hypothetical protein [Streptomyces sp. H27-G5]MCY0957207.1 hypothetical protein [Streptomyces sp. H27-H5]
MSRDLKNSISAAPSLAPAARTAAADGAAVDLAGYGNSVVIIDTGTVTGTTPLFTFEVQESDTTTGGDFTAVADADLDGTEPAVSAANDETVFRIGYRGRKRYLRVILKTVGGTSTPTLPCTGLVLRGSPRKAPK